MPLVSVIVPVYNTEYYLPHCIESILSQSFRDLELILVDDGSTDNSGMICDQYAVEDNRAKVIHCQNGGVSVARNTGMKQAIGKYLMFVDSDDWLAVECLENMIEAIREANADLCVARLIKVETDDVPISECQIESILSGREALEIVARENSNRYRCCPAKLVKRNIATQFLFPVGRRWSEDTAVIYKWYHKSKTVVFMNYSPYYYRYNPESASNTRNLLVEFEEIDTWHEQLKLYAKEYRELYIVSLKKYRRTLSRWMSTISQNPDYSVYKKRITNELRKVLVILFFYDRSFVQRFRWQYEEIFPCSARIYWLCKACINKMKRLFDFYGKD